MNQIRNMQESDVGQLHYRLQLFRNLQLAKWSATRIDARWLSI